jgi:hypothetical protein
MYLNLLAFNSSNSSLVSLQSSYLTPAAANAKRIISPRPLLLK